MQLLASLIHTVRLLHRYEDNGDSLNNVVVVAKPSDKSSIEGYGGPDAFLNSISSMFGTQVFKGEAAVGMFWPHHVGSGSMHALPLEID